MKVLLLSTERFPELEALADTRCFSGLESDAAEARAEFARLEAWADVLLDYETHPSRPYYGHLVASSAKVRAIWFTDTLSRFFRSRPVMIPFDVVFVEHLDGLSSRRFKEIAFWLPPGVKQQGTDAVGAVPNAPRDRPVGLFDAPRVGRDTAVLKEIREALLRRFSGAVTCFTETQANESESEFLSRCKVVVNFTSGLDPEAFHAMACGALQVLNDAPEVRVLFEDRRHLRLYDTGPRLFDVVADALARPAAARDIARAGQELVLREHTLSRRFQTILDVLAARFRQGERFCREPLCATTRGPRGAALDDLSRLAARARALALHATETLGADPDPAAAETVATANKVSDLFSRLDDLASTPADGEPGA
ncbi:MAG: glycosyltransferase family 1 protein [Planctomycetes bacterium]|nr:glycosyltransferase family 1 protein [Planctomycetota bacterium]